MAGVLDGLVIAAHQPALPGLSHPPRPLDIEGLWFLPLSQATRQELSRPGESVIPMFLELTDSVAAFAASLSKGGKALYLHLEFHGGQGTHEVLGWRDGNQDLGPLFTKTAHEPAADWYLAVEPRDMAINVGLRWIGVMASDGLDEFSSAGLHRHRWSEDWDAE